LLAILRQFAFLNFAKVLESSAVGFGIGLAFVLSGAFLNVRSSFWIGSHGKSRVAGRTEVSVVETVGRSFLYGLGITYGLLWVGVL